MTPFSASRWLGTAAGLRVDASSQSSLFDLTLGPLAAIHSQFQLTLPRDSSPSSFRPVLGLAVASVSLGCPSRQAAEVVSLSRDALTPPRVPSEAVR